jgi:hypothetical protein
LIKALFFSEAPALPAAVIYHELFASRFIFKNNPSPIPAIISYGETKTRFQKEKKTDI